VSKKESKPSLEDMMEDLQRAGNAESDLGSEPVLVTREDGSEMMRVKKRKRRSNQSRKAEFNKRKKKKFLLIVAFVILTFMVVLGGVIGLAYYNSKSFHQKVEETIALNSGAEAELGLLSVGPNRATFDELSLIWPEGKGPIDELTLNEVNADYGFQSLLGGVWSGSVVQARSGVLTLRDVKDLNFGGVEDSPIDFKFSSYGCKNLDVHLGEIKEIPIISKADVRAKLHGSNRPQLEFNGGLLNYPNFEGLSIESGVLIFGDSEGDLILRLMTENKRGYLSLDGKVPYRASNTVSLNAKLESFPLVRFLTDDSKRFFEAGLDSDSVSMILDSADSTNLEIVGNFQAERFRIRDFVFLSDLATVLGNNWYENPRFTKMVSGKIERKGKNLELKDLVFEESSYLKIKGNVRISEAGDLSGIFQVGIPINLVNLIRDKVPAKMFSGAIEGYVWTDVKLSGTTASVADDFGARLKGISTGGSKPFNNPPVREKSLEDEFDSLTE